MAAVFDSCIEESDEYNRLGGVRINKMDIRFSLNYTL